MNAVKVGLRFSKLLADVDESNLTGIEKAMIFRSIAGTALAIFAERIDWDARDKELDRLLKDTIYFLDNLNGELQ